MHGQQNTKEVYTKGAKTPDDQSFTVVPKVFQPSVLKLLHVTLPRPRSLRWLPDFRRIWYPLVQTTFAT